MGWERLSAWTDKGPANVRPSERRVSDARVTRLEREASGNACTLSGLKTVSDLKIVSVWVNPDHLVSTCRLLLSGHKLWAIGVVEHNELVGVVGFDQLSGAPETSRVRDVMAPVGPTATADQSIRSLAGVLASEDLAYIPVVHEGKFMGMVTATMLLKEMSRTWDPLTGLSWSDRLRDWGVEKLKDTGDVTIIFLDLDDFGQYNKRYGHIVGDRVLQKVAKYLGELVDDSRDILVRYAGDEFAIGTIRTRAEAERLVEIIQHRIDGIFIGEAEQPVAVSVGIFGGRRTHERENIHFAATLDSLINLASKDCMAKKAQKKTVRATPPATPVLVEERIDVPQILEEPIPTESKLPSLDLIDVDADPDADRGVTMVTISHAGGTARGIHVRSGDVPAVESVVRATLNAIERVQPELQIQLRHVELRSSQGEPSAIELQLSSNRWGEKSLLHPVETTVLRAAASATLAAVAENGAPSA